MKRALYVSVNLILLTVRHVSATAGLVSNLYTMSDSLKTGPLVYIPTGILGDDEMMFADGSAWLQPYVPHSLSHSASILADFVDFWEEERFRQPNGFYRPRDLTTFLENGNAADRRLKPRFKQLLLEYMHLITSHPTSSTDWPAEYSGFFAERHCNVQLAMSYIREWLAADGMDAAGVAGRKRQREEGRAWRAGQRVG
jgi:hypothetical protein